MIKFNTDIIIIGGGIAGCIAAISLAEHFQVTLIDKLSEPADRIGESLAPAAQRILKHLNLCQNLEPTFEQKLYRKNLGMQSYWGSDRVHIVDHLRNPDGFGLNLDRKEFEIYLRQIAEKRGVQCLWSTRLQGSDYLDNHWEITAKSENDTYIVSTEFVIDATGRQSHFARSQNIQRTPLDKLIACWMSMPDSSENKMSTISASENGWWYSAVVPNDKRVVAFQTDSDLLNRATFKSLESFLRISNGNKHIKTLLKNTDLSTIRFHGVTAANSTQLNEVCGKQWAAIGDAAISFDPLSSQGMFNAMASGMQLKELILEFGFSEGLEKEYSLQISSIWQHYLKHKNIFYQQEQRWKNHEFWKRRHF